VVQEKTFFDNYDTVFNPSSQFRHLLLSLKHLEIAERIGKVVLLVNETDGGIDNVITTVRGQICDLLLWMSKSDAVYHIKSASGRSSTDIRERLMAIFNIALDCVALARAPMSELCESWLKNCCTLKEIREQAEKHPELKNEISGSLKPVIDILDELFSQLELNDEIFIPSEPTSSHILEVGKLLKNLNPEFGVKGP